MDNDLSIIKERLNKTTKGNWKFGRNGALHSTETHEHLMHIGSSGDIVMKHTDMVFIENAKSDVKYLVSQAEKLEKIQKLLTVKDMGIWDFARQTLAILEDIESPRRKMRQ